MRKFYFDTETHPIEPGILAPRMVCLQFAYDSDPPQVVLADEAEPILREMLQAPDVLPTAWNGAYDYAVIAARFPSLIPLIYKMLADRRGRDLMLRETLVCIEHGTLRTAVKSKGYFSLAKTAERYLMKALDKGESSPRMHYGDLDGVPVSEWDEAALEYALEDVRTLQELEQFDGSLADERTDEWLQVFSAFALHLCAVWGVRVDGPKLAALSLSLEQEQGALTTELVASGLMDPDGTMKVEAAQNAVVEACAKRGIPIPKTPKGNIKTDEATIADFDDHPALAKRATFKGNQKVLSTYLLPMRSGITRAMNSRPNVLVASGRTSWAGSKITLPDGGVHVEGTNLQNFPTKGGVRDCIVPRPGYVWLGVDYSSLELRTLAQACLWICDKSKLAEGYRSDPDYDPHTEFGAKLARISLAEAKAKIAAKDRGFKSFRQRAKAANFGFPGGLGAVKFQKYAKGYGLDLTVRECYALKDAWSNQFPEIRDYFTYVDYLVNAGGSFRQFVSGRVRGGTGFCDGANSFFQGLAADGVKLALCAVSQACYAEPSSPLFGSRIVAMIHDELDLEVPADRANEAAAQCVQLMEREMQKVTPDVPHKAVPALSTAWLKEAEEKRDEKGRLVVWG